MAPGLRKAVASLQQYIATPRVSKHRLFVWITSNTLPDDGIFVFPREDDYFFGLLHSCAHEKWARATGTQLREAESGFRYTPKSCFDTHPFPWPPGTEPSEKDDARVKEIAEAARELVRLRDEWLAGGGGVPNLPLEKRTLTGLYNKRPDWLDLAHQRLDAAVFAAYGWPIKLSDDAILERLLALNLQRAAAQGAAPAASDEQTHGEAE